MAFQINDRVKVVKTYMGKEEIRDKVGTVIYICQNGTVVVEFDNYIAGHDGLGTGKWGFCWNFHSNVLDFLEVLKNTSFEIGDIVSIIDSGITVYAPNSARAWIKEVTPEYKNYSIVGTGKSVNKAAKYIVLAVDTLSKHQKCLISDMKSKEVILIGSEFLTLECKNVDKPKLNSLDFVKVINLTEVYPNYEEWLEDQGVNCTNWKQGSIPTIDEEYLLLFAAPKADFPPFNKENLCLIQGSYISNNGKYVPCEDLGSYIVSEKALYGINKNIVKGKSYEF